MEKPNKPKKKSFWDRAEDVGDTVEFGVRMIWALVMACLFASLAWWLGSEIWAGLAVMLAVPAFLLGLPVGFFWPEVKLLGGVVLRMFFSPD